MYELQSMFATEFDGHGFLGSLVTDFLMFCFKKETQNKREKGYYWDT